jgi:hypothetical protein
MVAMLLVFFYRARSSVIVKKKSRVHSWFEKGEK